MNLELIGFLACAAAAASATAAYVRPGAPGAWNSRWIFTLLLTAALCIFQRDAIRANFQLWNPDESHMLAGALTLQERPVFWRDVDGVTHGPLDQLPLLLPTLVGARIDYTSARVVATGLTVLLLTCLHLALARGRGEGVARLLILPGWALFIFNQDPETAQYTSELMPSLLLAAGAAWLGPAPTGLSRRRLYLAGVLCGAVPLAKLQAGPIAGWLFLCLCYADCRRTAGPAASRWRGPAWLVAGALTPVCFFVGVAAVCGAWEDFRIRYVEFNLQWYATDGEKYFNDALPLPGMIFGLGSFLWPVTAGILAGSFALTAWRQPAARAALVGSIGLVLTTLFTVYFPHKPFAHYFLLLIGPLIQLLGATAGNLLTHLAGKLGAGWRAGCAAVAIAGLAGPVVVHHFQHPGYFRAVLPTRPPVARPLIEALQRHTSPGQEMAVWGWQPALYVFTQTVSATPDQTVFAQIIPSRWLDFYQSRYLRALVAHRPVVFVDTMGKSDFFFFRNGAATRHENFPALRDVIARDYLLAETVADARIYVRRDKAPSP